MHQSKQTSNGVYVLICTSVFLVNFKVLTAMTMAVFWNAEPCSLVARYGPTSIALTMEAVSSSETLVNIYHTTQCYIPVVLCVLTATFHTRQQVLQTIWKYAKKIPYLRVYKPHLYF
jgi:hypothetical protein